MELGKNNERMCGNNNRERAVLGKGVRKEGDRLEPRFIGPNQDADALDHRPCARHTKVWNGLIVHHPQNDLSTSTAQLQHTSRLIIQVHTSMHGGECYRRAAFGEAAAGVAAVKEGRGTHDHSALFARGGEVCARYRALVWGHTVTRCYLKKGFNFSFPLCPFLTQAQFQQSVTYFQRFFELARGLSDNAMLEAARFNLGVARGAVLMEGRSPVVCTRSNCPPPPAFSHQALHECGELRLAKAHCLEEQPHSLRATAKIAACGGRINRRRMCAHCRPSLSFKK
eukprot:scaffold186177_cov19-Tisochrysis_lutea.AAC.2